MENKELRERVKQKNNIAKISCIVSFLCAVIAFVFSSLLKKGILPLQIIGLVLFTVSIYIFTKKLLVTYELVLVEGEDKVAFAVVQIMNKKQVAHVFIGVDKIIGFDIAEFGKEEVQKLRKTDGVIDEKVFHQFSFCISFNAPATQTVYISDNEVKIAVKIESSPAFFNALAEETYKFWNSESSEEDDDIAEEEK